MIETATQRHSCRVERAAALATLHPNARPSDTPNTSTPHVTATAAAALHAYACPCSVGMPQPLTDGCCADGACRYAKGISSTPPTLTRRWSPRTRASSRRSKACATFAPVTLDRSLHREPSRSSTERRTSSNWHTASEYTPADVQQEVLCSRR